MHVVAAAFTVAALIVILVARISVKRFMGILAAVLGGLAALMAVIALVLDILFFTRVQHGIDGITDLSKTTLGIGSSLCITFIHMH